jgi:hypothetical protein
MKGSGDTEGKERGRKGRGREHIEAMYKAMVADVDDYVGT